MTAKLDRPSVLKALQRLQTEGNTFTPLQICVAMGLRRSKDRIHRITVLLHDLARSGLVSIHCDHISPRQTVITFSTPVVPLWLQLWYLWTGTICALVRVPKQIAPRRKTRAT